MKKIPLSKIEEGMVLARPIVGPDGKILVAEGGTLSPGISERLQRWGILNAYIQSDGDVDSSASDGSKRKLEKLEKTFSKVMDDCNMRTLYNELSKYFQGNC